MNQRFVFVPFFSHYLVAVDTGAAEAAFAAPILSVSRHAAPKIWLMPHDAAPMIDSYQDKKKINNM